MPTTYIVRISSTEDGWDKQVDEATATRIRDVELRTGGLDLIRDDQQLFDDLFKAPSLPFDEQRPVDFEVPFY